MIKTHLFASKGGNSYVYSPKLNQFLFVHPLVAALYLDAERNGSRRSRSPLNANRERSPLKENRSFTRSDFIYYRRKFRYLTKAGYFDEIEFSKQLNGRLTGKDVRRFVAQTPNLIFEVTDLCNLDCKYCIYGDLYESRAERLGVMMDRSLACLFLNRLLELRKRGVRSRGLPAPTIGFYGGEPLLNLPLIKDIVAYAERNSHSFGKFGFQMTTNGTLIAQHMDYLESKDFGLSISLDGDEHSHSYRVFKDGRPSQKTVEKSALTIRSRYPEYFERRVSFISVLHDRNPRARVLAYFKRYFGKSPLAYGLTTVGGRPERRRELQSMIQDLKSEDPLTSRFEVCPEDESWISDPEVIALSQLMRGKSGYFFNSFRELSIAQDTTYVPTGTCLPFSRRMFVSVSGKILPCERIAHKFVLGDAGKSGEPFDYDRIAEKYNGYFAKMRPLCSQCYCTTVCPKCMFHLNIEEASPTCEHYADYESYAKYLSGGLSYLEQNPSIYSKILIDITVA